MKATVKFYPANDSGCVPEIESLTEEFEVESREKLIEYAKDLQLPASVEYAHCFIEGSDDPIAVIQDGVRDMESGEWIIEPDED